MRDIIDGFLRFQRDAYPARSQLFKSLATRQAPKALFIACSDSRCPRTADPARARRTLRDP